MNMKLQTLNFYIYLASLRSINPNHLDIFPYFNFVNLNSCLANLYYFLPFSMILIIYYYFDRGKFSTFINKFQNKESIRFIILSLIVNLNLTV